MSPDDWFVGIPSRGRAASLNHKTLRVLAESGVPSERVIVFVHRREFREYDECLDDDLYGELVTHDCVGDMSCIHNFILDSLGPGNVVQMDDDITAVHRAVDAKTKIPVALPLLFARGFILCEETGASLWGVYPVDNPFYMSPGKVRLGLSFCIGQCFGQVVAGRPHERTSYVSMEDYERSLLHFMHDGAVVRFDDVACQSKVYSGEGGLQGVRTPEREREIIADLSRRFPGLVKPKKSGGPSPEIRLVNPRP